MNSIPTPILPKIDNISFYKSLLTNFLPLWPIAWIMLVWVVIVAIYKTINQIKLSKSGIFEIDKMTGQQFEERLAILFRNLGYKVERTGKVGDYGVDLVIEKDGIRTAVQAKCYKNGKVRPDAIQQVNTGKNWHHCTEAMVVSNQNYTKEAWRLAKSVGVKLWSRNYLVKVILTEKSLKQR